MYLRNFLFLLILSMGCTPAWADNQCPDSVMIKKQNIINADPNPHGINNWDATSGDFRVTPEGSRWNVAVQNFKMPGGSTPSMAMEEAQKLLKNTKLILKPKLIPRPDDPTQFMCIYFQEGGIGNALFISAYQYQGSDRG